MLKWLQTCQQEPNHQSTDNYIDDEEIDVENIKECPRRIAIDRRKNYNQNNNYSTDSTLIPIELDEDLLPFHNFVCDTARDIGIKIGPEEIVPGILYCAASRVIMRVNIFCKLYSHLYIFGIRIALLLLRSIILVFQVFHLFNIYKTM